MESGCFVMKVVSDRVGELESNFAMIHLLVNTK